eukprot:7242563-Prymnesium_polylepis.1
MAPVQSAARRIGNATFGGFWQRRAYALPTDASHEFVYVDLGRREHAEYCGKNHKVVRLRDPHLSAPGAGLVDM